MKRLPLVTSLLLGLTALAMAEDDSANSEADYTIKYRSAQGGFAFALDDAWGRIEPPKDQAMSGMVEVMYWHEPAKATLSLVKVPFPMTPAQAETRLGFLLGQLIPGFEKTGVDDVKLGGRAAKQLHLQGSREKEWGRERFEVTAFEDRDGSATWLFILRVPVETKMGTADGTYLYPTFNYGPRPNLPKKE